MQIGSAACSFAGGIVLGSGGALLWWSHGRLAGVSGIAGGLLSGRPDRSWRMLFLAGLLCSGVALARWVPEAAYPHVSASVPVVAVAGLLIGIGNRLGNGCTSGHGVCGVSRLSPRSFVATSVFILMGAVTVLCVRAFGGVL